MKERLDRFEEACQVVTGLLREDRTTFEGSHYRVVDAPCEPKPVQRPLPFLIGGGGEKRTLAIAARYADEWNVWGTPEMLAHKNEVLDRHCEAIGRDPSTIRRTCQALVGIHRHPGRAPTGRPPDGRRHPRAGRRDHGRLRGRRRRRVHRPVLRPGAAGRGATVDRFMAEVVPLVP